LDEKQKNNLQSGAIKYRIIGDLFLFDNQQSTFGVGNATGSLQRSCFSETGHSKQKTNSNYNIRNPSINLL
jgi:hypothetical protein